MSTIKVQVDMNVCGSNGLCVGVAPDLFELDDDDILRWQAEADESRRGALEEAVTLCPTQAISLED